MMQHDCIKDEQIQAQSRKIEKLEARADFKDQRLDSMDRKLDEISKTLDELKTQSIKDDNEINQRVTSLESTQSTLKWVTGVGLSALSVAVAFMAIIFH